MVLNKDENIEKTKSKGEAKREDEQYGNPNQQCEKHRKVVAAETKTNEREKENQVDKISTGEEYKNKNTSKINKLETRHSKLHQETLEDAKIEPELNEEKETENRQQLKEDTDNKKNRKKQSKNKPKEITLEKTGEREQNIGEIKPQNITKPLNITEDCEKEIWMGGSKYVETGVQ